MLTNQDRLHALQECLGDTQLVILDEISMVGRQFMGKIDSRLEQGRKGKNPEQELLDGVSLLGVGDVAQCEAMLFDGVLVSG